MLVVIVAPMLAALVLGLVVGAGTVLRRPAVTTVGECRHRAGQPCRHRPLTLPAADPPAIEEGSR